MKKKKTPKDDNNFISRKHKINCIFCKYNYSVVKQCTSQLLLCNKFALFCCNKTSCSKM